MAEGQQVELIGQSVQKVTTLHQAVGRYGCSSERFEWKHVKGAVSIPLEEIGRNRSSLPEDKDAPVIAVCDVGRISVTGMLYLRSLVTRT